MKKSLLLISYDFPPSTGGIARLCNEISMGMHSYYSKIVIITRSKEATSAHFKNADVEIIKLPAKRIYCELHAIRTIRSIKNKSNYDVLCGVWHPEAILAKLGGMKNISILGHGTEFLYGNSSFRKYVWLPIYGKWIFNNVKQIITNSAYTKNLVLGIAPKAKVIPLPLAVDHTFFKPSNKENKSGKVIFSTVSRVLQFKGHDFILRTFENLPEKIRSRIQWNIAGTGPYLDELKSLVKDSKIAKQVRFFGFVKDENLPEFYRNSDVFIMMTREQCNSTQVEGFGLVFLEAQACGIAAIGAKTGGIPDAIDHGNGGWLVEQDNENELSSLLVNLISNPGKIKSEGNKARIRVEEQSTWEMYCKKLSRLL